MKVYKDFSQSELDRQYNVRAGIPDTREIFRRWEADSRDVRQRFKSQLKEDIKYGADPAQGVDVFSAAAPGRPLVVFIHGGYWQSLDKSYFSYLADAYLLDEFNFAAVNYRLAPGATMDEIVEDCRKSISFLWRNADDLKFDKDRIFVTGSSAGGHLVAEMLSTDWSARALPSDLIKGGCALSGLYDLEPIRLCYLNEAIKLDAEMASRNSPINHVPQHAPPLLLAFGGDETEEFDRQQSDYARAWRAKGLQCRVVEQSDGHHFDMVDRLGDRKTSLYQAVKNLIEQRALADKTAENLET